jgi:hypothetical protein
MTTLRTELSDDAVAKDHRDAAPRPEGPRGRPQGADRSGHQPPELEPSGVLGRTHDLRRPRPGRPGVLFEERWRGSRSPAQRVDPRRATAPTRLARSAAPTTFLQRAGMLAGRVCPRASDQARWTSTGPSGASDRRSIHPSKKSLAIRPSRRAGRRHPRPKMSGSPAASSARRQGRRRPAVRGSRRPSLRSDSPACRSRDPFARAAIVRRRSEPP